MHNVISLRRSILLTLSLLSACAAGTAGSDVGSHSEVRLASRDTQPSDVSGEYLTGRFAETTGDIDFAAEQFLRVVAVDPVTPEVQEQALLMTMLVNRPEALQLARAQPGNPAAQLVIANNNVRLGRWEAAEAEFAQLPRQGLTQVLEPLVVAWAQQGAGRTDAALATLKPYVEGPPNFRGVYAMHAALIADLAGRSADATRFYRAAQDEHGAMNLQLGRLVASWQARQGHPAEARRSIDDMVAGAGDLAVAETAMKADVARRQVRGAADGIAEAYLALAAALRVQEAEEFSKVLLRLALDLRPDFSAARILYGDILENSKQPAAALEVYGGVPNSDPLAAIVALRRAALEQRLGESDQALATLDRLARDLPGRPEPLTLKGDILRDKKQFGEAVAAYNEAIARAPNPTRTDWPLFYDRGIALERSHQWPLAEADFKRALELSPDEPFVLNYLAYSWTERGENLDEARRMLERAVEQRPSDGAIIDSLGWLMLRQGDTSGAVKQLEKASELESVDPTINAHLGDAYWAAGRKLEAEYQWRRSLNFGPDPEDVPKLEAKLSESEKALGHSLTAPAQSGEAAKTVQ